MKSVALAQAVPVSSLESALEYVRDHGALTLPLLRRAVRDAAILSDLSVYPGQYVEIGMRWGVSDDTVRVIEETAKKYSRTM
jgi:hypothetical protein